MEDMFPKATVELNIEGEEEEMCSICHENLINARKIKQCHHKFHIKCLLNWLTAQNSTPNCPICRTPIPNIDALTKDDDIFYSIFMKLRRLEVRVRRMFSWGRPDAQQQPVEAASVAFDDALLENI